MSSLGGAGWCCMSSVAGNKSSVGLMIERFLHGGKSTPVPPAAGLISHAGPIPAAAHRWRPYASAAQANLICYSSITISFPFFRCCGGQLMFIMVGL